MKSYRIGIVGLGVMGREMAAALDAHPRFKVAAGVDPRHPNVPFPLFKDAATLMQKGEIDAIYAATPPRHHEAIVRLAVEARKPILCEKPLAHSIASARDCRDLVNAAGLPAAVNFSFAARDVAVRLHRVVASGALGQIREVSLRVRFGSWPRQWQSGAGAWLAGPEEGGFTREVISHFVFLANRLLGPGQLQAVTVERAAAGTETKLAAEILHGNIAFTIDAGIGGTRDDDNRFLVRGDRGEIALVDWSRLDYAGDAGPVLPESAPLDALADLLDGKPHGLASFDEGLAVVELVERMLNATA